MSTESAKKPSVLFVCVHNAGRSQMAAAFLTSLSKGAIEVRSAGSQPADKINPAESATRYPVESSINATLIAAVKAGQSIEEALPALQSQLAGLAASAGYGVSEK